MSVYATIQQAALAAARFAWPSMPDDWIAWDEHPAVQCDYAVILHLVSQTPEDRTPYKIETIKGNKVEVELVQRALLNIDVRLESYAGTELFETYEDAERHIMAAANKMVLGWSTKYVKDLLGCDIAIAGPFGKIINASADRNGVTLPMCSFELPLRAVVSRLIDPTRRTLIKKIAAVGKVDGSDTDGFEVGPPP